MQIETESCLVSCAENAGWNLEFRHSSSAFKDKEDRTFILPFFIRQIERERQIGSTLHMDSEVSEAK